MITSKKTWFAHMFRTGNFSINGQSSFPYPLSNEAQERARVYSKDMWRNNRWSGQVRPLSWMVDHFWPVPGWDDADLEEQRQRDSSFEVQTV